MRKKNNQSSFINYCNNMSLTKEEIRKKIELAFLQYDTIDRCKCERYGTLMHGILAVRKNKQDKIIPFHTTIDKAGELIDYLIDISLEQNADELVVVFPQHYIHYT